MDKIHIKNLEVFANHGVYPEENKLGQKFVVSAILYADLREAGKTDDLTKSIHYGEVSLFMKDFIESHTFGLIETVAERLAEGLLLSIPKLLKVNLKIDKPWAPIGLPLESAAVEIERQWHEVFVALGSNMGDKKAYLNMAVESLSQTKGCQVDKVSSFIITEPYGVTDQEEFLNGCLRLQTLLTPMELLDLLHKIEQAADRVRDMRWGPRTLDLDILFYDDLIYDSEVLKIPHIDLHRREFVLRPLLELAPYQQHPITKKTVTEMLEQIAEVE